jgi:hypothetical protein
MITTKQKFRSKYAKVTKSRSAMNETHKKIHKDDDLAHEKGLVLIDEYKFPHAALPLAQNHFSGEGCQYAFNLILEFLKPSRSEGLSIVLSPQWMFVAIVTKPYYYETRLNIPGADLENGVPVYLDGFAYSGIINLQPVSQKWPQSAGLNL